MAGGSVVGRGSLRAGMILIFAFLCWGGMSAALAGPGDGSVGVGGIDDSATPAAGEAESGNPLELLPAQETPPADAAKEILAESTPPSATPPGGRDNEALAPGTVTVILTTSDRNPLPNRATICVSGICQSGANMRSGVSFWFEKVEAGWHQITVEVGSPYGSTMATVEVRDGINGVVELILVPVQSVPGESIESPPPSDGNLQSAPRNQISEPALSSSGLSVSALPSTGTGVQGGTSFVQASMLAALAVVLVGTVVATAGASRRSR